MAPPGDRRRRTAHRTLHGVRAHAPGGADLPRRVHGGGRGDRRPVPAGHGRRRSRAPAGGADAAVNRLLATVVAAALAAPAAAQLRGETRVEAVVVPVTVRTTRGRLVSRVNPSRFHLYVDGMEIPIRDISREEELPLSLGFIIDTSGSMGGHKLQACRDLVMAFLDRRAREDEVALWTFGDGRVLDRFHFGSGWYLVPRILESLRPWGDTALYDVLARVPEVVAGARHPRRAVILLTDGVDTASTMGPEEAQRLVERLRTPIYVLGVEPPPKRVAPSGPTYEEILARIAEGSGGRYRRVPSTREMPEVVGELLEELSSRYIITFPTSRAGERRWRRIEVTVDGYTATTRKGYFGRLPG
ncbi:MAG: VWA domain-containing protein [Nitrospirae bacterium]|nr:MAG: VWA domain-containing protein [Nitrospirota bacterium]